MMHVLRYTLLHIRRRPLQFLCVFVAVSLLGCLLLSVHTSMQVRQTSLDTLVDSSEVWCVIGRVGNARWAASAHHVSQLLQPDAGDFAAFVDAYVTDVRAKATLNVSPTGMPAEVEATFLTCWEADDSLRLLDERRLTMVQEYDTSCLRGSETVCIAGSMVAPLGASLTFALPENCGGTEITVRVVGTITDDDSIYLPWTLYESSIPDLYAATPADSVSFRLKDNHLIDAFRQEAAAFYAPEHASSGEYPSYEHTLVIRDAQFRENTTAAERNLTMMRMLTPAFLVMALGIGLLLVALMLRTRRTEYAILRSMGQSAKFILLQSVTETLLAAVPGCTFALIVLRSAEIAQLLPLLIAFVLGGLLPVIRYTTQPVLHQVKGES